MPYSTSGFDDSMNSFLDLFRRKSGGNVAGSMYKKPIGPNLSGAAGAPAKTSGEMGGGSGGSSVSATDSSKTVAKDPAQASKMQAAGQIAQGAALLAQIGLAAYSGNREAKREAKKEKEDALLRSWQATSGAAGDRAIMTQNAIGQLMRIGR